MAKLSKLTSREAVERAIAESDTLGRTAFRKKYGYGAAKGYFLEYKGRFYDSKAITGVAYGLQYPNDGALTWRDFNGDERTVRATLERLGFPVVTNPWPCLVLAENEVHARPEFSKWLDVTGERYHFPNAYKNRIVPGKYFVYYRGVRRKIGRGQAEYFGWGRIGSVYPDPLTVDKPAAQRHWLCDVEEYHAFSSCVPIRDAGNRYYETARDSTPQRYWESGVREISQASFDAILKAARVELIVKSGTGPSLHKLTTSMTNVPGLTFLVKPSGTGRKGARGQLAIAGRSGKAKEIGDLGERLVYEWLKANATPSDAEKIIWVASLGETPGWDIEDRRPRGPHSVFEVKATNGTQFPAFDITVNEWNAARKLREHYNLVLVTQCDSDPKMQIINNPSSLIENGVLELAPTVFRVALA